MARRHGTPLFDNAFKSNGIWTPQQIRRQQMLNLWEPGADPYWGNVVLLVQPSANDTSVVDRSSSGKTVVVHGSAPLSVVSPFPGGASIQEDGGAANFLTVADDVSLDLSTGAFVLEGLAYLRDAAEIALMSKRISAFGSGMWQVYCNLSSQLALSVWNGSANEVHTYTSSTFFANALNYWAVTRDVSGNVRAYLHGKILSDGATSFSNSQAWDNACDLGVGYIGYAGSATEFNGFYCAARITKGTDRGMTGATIPLPTGPWPTR